RPPPTLQFPGSRRLRGQAAVGVARAVRRASRALRRPGGTRKPPPSPAGVRLRRRPGVPVRRSAAVSATVAARAAITVATATAAPTGLTGPGLVHREATSAHVVSVELFDGTPAILVAHLHEPEAAGAAGIAI